MSGYAQQERSSKRKKYTVSEQRVIDSHVGETMLQQALKKTDGAIAKLLLSAVDEGWEIRFPVEGSQILNTDEIIADALVKIESESPIMKAYGQLILHSIDPKLIEPVKTN